MELATGVMAAKQPQTAQALQLQFIKSNLDAQASVANMLLEAVKAAPPPGQGTKVDISA